MDKKLRVAFCVFATILLIQLVSCDGQDYAKIVSEKVKHVLGPLPGYQWSGYPVDNFGLATAYPKDDDYSSICATYSCLALERPSDISADLSVGGFADIGAGGPITLTEAEERALTSEVLLPEFFKIIGVSANIDIKKGVKTTLAIGPATLRNLNYEKYISYIKSLPPDRLLKQQYDKKNLKIIVSDVVVSSLDLSLVVDSSLNAGLKAELDAKLSTPILAKDSKMSVSVSTSAQGTYKLSSTHPVIVARYAKAQPLVLEKSVAPWAGWTATTVKDF